MNDRWIPKRVFFPILSSKSHSFSFSFDKFFSFPMIYFLTLCQFLFNLYLIFLTPPNTSVWSHFLHFNTGQELQQYSIYAADDTLYSLFLFDWQLSGWCHKRKSLTFYIWNDNQSFSLTFNNFAWQLLEPPNMETK